MMDSTLNSQAYNQSYNPNDGLLSFNSIYGDNTAVTFQYVQALVNERTSQGIVFGTRCGAAVLTLVLMWMISKSRKTPVFIINFISLSLVIVHSALYCRYLLSGYASIAYALTGFPQLVKASDLHAYAACNIVQALLVTSIETSLFFQVRVIFAGDNSKRVGLILTTLAAALGIATVVMYFYSAIAPIVSLHSDSSEVSPTFFNVSLILLASSINFTTFLLVIKLTIAVKSRRFLGLKQFDSFYILLIISFQTLMIPSILFILAYSLPEDKGTDYLIPIATLVVVLSLPLSSMWATASNKEFKSSSVSQFYPSSGGYSDGSSNYCSDSDYISSKRSIKQKLFETYPKSRAESDKQSERTYCAGGDLEKGELHELSTPISQVDGHGFTSQQETEKVNHTHPIRIVSWTNSGEQSTWPISAGKTESSEDDQSGKLDFNHDSKDEGFIETKRITLKK